MSFLKLKDVYTLNSDSFTLIPEIDWICYFGRNEIQRDLEKNVIGKALSANRPPKAVVFGYWGTGKTQTLWHLINTSLRNMKCIYVELPEFPTTATFIDFYKELMRNISLTNLRKNADAIKRKYGTFDNFYRKFGGPGEEKRNVFSLLDSLIVVSEDSKEELEIWSWLSGHSVRSPTKIGLPEGVNEITIGEAISILWLLGKFSIEEDEKFLIFCLDEAHRLKDIKEGTYPERTFIQAFRNIFLKDFPVGFLFSVGVGTERDLPHMLMIGEVRTRIGTYIHLESMSEPEILEVVKGIVKYVRDSAKWDQNTSRIVWNKPKKETIDKIAKFEEQGIEITLESYPFTEEAITQLVDYLMDAQYILYRTPRRICDSLDFISSEYEALENGYIDKDLVMLTFPKYIESNPLAEEE